MRRSSLFISRCLLPLLTLSCGGRSDISAYYTDGVFVGDGDVGAGGATAGSAPIGGAFSTGGAAGGGTAVGGTSSGDSGGASGGGLSTPCDFGEFDVESDPTLTECEPWTDCAPGSFQQEPPDAEQDRSCQMCPMGTFTDQDNLTTCAEWRRCGFGLVEDQPGTSSANVTCKPDENFPAVSFDESVTTGRMSASSDSVYLALSVGPDEAPEVLQMSLDGTQVDHWSVSSAHGADVASLTTLGTDVYVVGREFADTGDFGDRRGMIVKFDLDGNEIWRVNTDHPDAWLLNAHITTDGTNLYIAWHTLGILSCMDQGGYKYCLEEDRSELTLASYDPDGNLLWESTHGDYFRFASVSDLAVADGNLYVSGELSYGSGLHRFDADGLNRVEYSASEVGGAVGHFLAPDPAGGLFAVTSDRDILLERLVHIEGDAVQVLDLLPNAGSDTFKDMIVTLDEVRLVGRDWETDQAAYARLSTEGKLFERITQGGSDSEYPTALAVAPSGAVFVGGSTQYNDENRAFVLPWR